MIELDDAAVLMRAKTIAAADGFTWQLDFDAHGARLRGLRFLSEDRVGNIWPERETRFAKRPAMPKVPSR
jgi:hypothetical protein